jgi:prepilin-type N-terminal cleavage/methylation domain-containing protein/prepilin-type processing-associated H-X9-DG protein
LHSRQAILRPGRVIGVRRGFTLIELLVVIAIISILASILFPVFSRARAKARQTACLSNMKQLGLALHMYAQDYEGGLPAWCFGATGSSDNGAAQGAYTWDTVIFPYTKNQQILTCPDSPFGRVVASGADAGLPVRSYAMPRYVGDPWGVCNAGMTYAPCPIDAPYHPAETVLLMEKGLRGIGIVGDAAGENFFQSHSCSLYPDLKKNPYHNEGKNFLFLDGHVKWYTASGGPFAYATAGGGEPPSGSHPLYEAHGPGHCEFYTDWPQ